MKTYLALGARIAAEPAWDREFGTIDFLTIARSQAGFAWSSQTLSCSADLLTPGESSRRGDAILASSMHCSFLAHAPARPA